MKKIILIFAVFALLGYALVKVFYSPMSLTAEMRVALQNSDTIMVHEGLPHQMFESEVLEREKKRKDVTMIEGYPFYEPSVIVPDALAHTLKQLLAEKSSYSKYQAGKKCGGFHPDYALSWKSGEHTYWLLICYGCGEVMFTDGGPKGYKYDLLPMVKDKLRVLTAEFEKKRPKMKSK